MYINKYDTLIFSELDKLFSQVEKDINIDKVLKKLESIEKVFDINLFKDLIKDIDKKLTDDYLYITKKIFINYLICILLYFHQDKEKEIKTQVIKLNFYKSDELGNVFKLYNDVINLILVANEEDREKLVKEYDTNINIKNAIDLSNKLGFDWIANNIKGTKKINVHNTVKIVIFKNYYQKRFRKQIFNIIRSNKNEYNFIDIIVPQIKVIDYNNIESLLSSKEKMDNLSEEIFSFISDFEKKIMSDYDIDYFTNVLLKKKIIVPIVDDFLRYHKINEKYEKNTSKIGSKERENKKDQTKIRYIISKTDKIKDYYSKKIQNNPSLKKEVEKQFYKPLQHRKAIIINEIEELLIINKLRKQGKTAIDSNEFFYDLINLRKSAYVNFKDFKDYGMNFLTTNSVTGIRYSLIEAKEDNSLISKNTFLETRVLGKNTRSNIVGFAILADNLETLKIKDIKNIRDSKEENGYTKFLEKIKEKINGDLDKNYYWIFNVNTDNKKTEFYERINTDEFKSDNYLKLLGKYLHNDVVDLIYKKIIEDINKKEVMYMYDSNQLIDFYQTKFININKFFNRNNIFDKIKLFANSKIPLIESTYDELEDKLFGFDKNSIKLPVIKDKKDDIATIVIKDEETEEIIENNLLSNSFCQHTIDWMNLSRLRNINPNKHTLLLYNFIEKFVIPNNENEYICKSCKQVLPDINSFLSNTYDGGSDGIDIVLASSRPLDEIYEYSKFKSSIKNMDKIIERISQITNFSYFIGNQNIHKFRRQEIIKLSIDIITIHDETLRTTNLNKRERERLATQNYGISPDNSNFFIFPLSNDIFKFSSKDVDKYKKIKLNNVITYIVFMMILELNITQIMNIEFDKSCNLFLFKKFGIKLFDNLYIRFNSSNNVVKIKKYESLCLVIFYFACMISKYNLWYHPLSDQKNFSIAFVQKDFIHSFVDMLNSVMEVYEKDDKHFLYKVICAKFSNKLVNIFSKQEIIDYIDNKESKKIIVDSESKKIKFIKSKIPSISLTGNLSKIEDNIYNYDKCRPSTYYIKKQMAQRDQDKILGKELDKIRNNMNLENMKKLSMIYDKNGKKLKNKKTYEEVSKLSVNDLEQVFKSVSNISIDKSGNLLKSINDNIYKTFIKVKENIKEDKYLDKFINIIKKEIGDTVKIRSIIYNIDENQFGIDHDYLGNSLNKKIYLNENDSKINVKYNSELGQKIYEINDKQNDVTLFYNYYSLHLLGYKNSTRGFVDMKNMSKYLQYIPSISLILSTLGFKRFHYKNQNKDSVKQIIRSASYNVKDYIRQIETGFNQIRYKINKISTNKIVLYYQKKISDLELRGEKGKVFKNWDNYLKLQNTQFNIKKEFDFENLSSLDISKLSGSYNEIISYLFSQILVLLEYNKDKFIRTNIIFFILSFTIYLFYKNFEQDHDFDMIRFNYILDLYDDFTDNAEALYTEEERENLSEEQKLEIDMQRREDEEWSSALDVDMEGDGDEDDEEVLFENLDISGRTSIY